LTVSIMSGTSSSRQTSLQGPLVKNSLYLAKPRSNIKRLTLRWVPSAKHVFSPRRKEPSRHRSWMSPPSLSVRAKSLLLSLTYPSSHDLAPDRAPVPPTPGHLPTFRGSSSKAFGNLCGPRTGAHGFLLVEGRSVFFL